MSTATDTIESRLDPPKIQAMREAARSRYCEVVRKLPDDAVIPYAQQSIPHDRLHPIAFYNSLPSDRRVDAYRATIMVYYLSNKTIIPKTTQLEAALCLVFGQDCVVIAPTGFGKTLVIIMALLLRPLEGSLLIVPLKRLQQCQVSGSHSFRGLSLLR